MKKTLVVGLVVTIILLSAVFYLKIYGGTIFSSGNVIEIVRTNDGYVPNEVTITAGDTILWLNESQDYHWPASNIHPTHAVYPEFDPRTPIAPGDTWSFTFTKTGEWAFHDHLRANVVGKVIVKDE